MLESVPIEVDILVEIVLISEKVAAGGENETLRHIGLGQEGLVGILDLEDILRGIVHIAASDLIAQIGVQVALPDHLEGPVDLDRAMIGGEEDLDLLFRQILDHVQQDGVGEPGGGDAAIRLLVIGQLAHHVHVRARMGEHIHKVEDDDIERVLHQIMEVVEDLFAELRIQDLGV